MVDTTGAERTQMGAPSPWDSPSRWAWVAFVGTLAITLPWLLRLHLIFDTDSYYHLAVAREYWQHGLISKLEWARMSVMRDGFGDKELLFHLLIAPFTATQDAQLGGKVAMALLVALNFASFAYFSVRALGPLGMIGPAVTLFGSVSFLLRVIRLRPELLALLLFMWTLYAIARRRFVAAAVLAALFAWSYTAIHALVGLCGLCFVMAWVVERKPHAWMALAPAIGAALGLLSHPHFPKNLEIFLIQNLQFWTKTDTLDVGKEIQALGLLHWLALDWPMLLGLGLVLATIVRTGATGSVNVSADDRRVALCFAVGALVFDALFVRAGRFSIYAVPLSWLALAWWLRSHGFALRAQIELPRGERLRTSIALAPILLAAAFHSFDELEQTADRSGGLWPAAANRLKQLGRALPKGAKVAATWESADDYVYWAPQARYLNLLDPIFMHLPHPDAHAALNRLFAGEELDVPHMLVTTLDSDYLAFEARRHPGLLRQVTRDPRFVALNPMGQVVYRVQPGANRAFVLDYVVHEGARKPADTAAFARYPRSTTTAGRSAEGIVTAQRLPGAARCLWFVHAREPGTTTDTTYELAATGPTELYADDAQVAKLGGSERLVLGRGTNVVIAGSARELAVRACPDPRGRSAFYLLGRP